LATERDVGRRAMLSHCSSSRADHHESRLLAMEPREHVCAIFANRVAEMCKVRIFLSLALLASATACGPAYEGGGWPWGGAYGGPGYVGPIDFHDRFHGDRFFHGGGFHGGGFHGGGGHGGGGHR